MTKREPKSLVSYINEFDDKEFNDKKGQKDPILKIAEIPGSEEPILGRLDKEWPVLKDRKRKRKAYG